MERLRLTMGLMAVTLMTAGAWNRAEAVDIATAKAGGVGAGVTLDNIVVSSTTDLVNSGSVKSIQAQDGTGGITIFGENALIDGLGVSPGDQITITGFTGTFNGLFQLQNDVSSPLAINSGPTPVGIPAPTNVAAVDFQDGSGTAEGLESKLVKLTGVTFADAGGTFSGLANYNVTDGFNIAVVRVSTSALNLIGTTIPGGSVDVFGIFSQFDNSSPFDAGYQLLVRSTADIIPTGGNSPPSAIDQETLLNKGASPVTFTLQATDIDGPFALSYGVKAGSASAVGPTLTGGASFGGTLVDPNDPAGCGGIDPNTCNDVTSGGALTTNEVMFVPDPSASGWFEFVFQANDGNDFGEGAVSILIQDTGRVVITEIMFDPSNVDDNDWEWIEVQNQTGAAITLNAIFDETLDPAHEFNMFGLQIPDSGTDDGLAIIAPENNGSRTVADFATEWGISVGQILTYLVPADPAQPPIFRNDEDTIYLFDDAGALLDVVHYENGANGWPASNNRGSIFLEYDQIDTVANDDPVNWNLSVAGANGVIATPETAGPPTDSDEGSPMFVPNAPTVQADPPSATGQLVTTSVGAAPITIVLDAIDPNLDPMDFIITTDVVGFGPTPGTSIGGTLTDPNGGAVGVFPYTLLAGGNEVQFTPTAAGLFAFGFRANDGSSNSNIAYVEVVIQAVDQVIITEIMYNPLNVNDSDYEYVEVYNPTGSDINLGSLWDLNFRANLVNLGNLGGAVLPAGDTKVIVRGDTTGTNGRTVADFITEWSILGLTAGDVISITQDQWPFLNNDGDEVYLFSSTGELLDLVIYDDVAPWPVDDGAASIFLKNPNLSSLDNDDAASWLLSIPGVEEALLSPGGDIGSPGKTAPGNNFPPTVEDVTAGTLINTPVTITLVATDDGIPGGPLTYTIETLPANGLLSDPNGGAIGAVPYTLLNNGDQVDYTPNAGFTSNILVALENFAYSAADGLNSSTNAIVDVVVQKGELVVSEIMYNPNNLADNDWEWVEVCNISGSDITLQILTDDDQEDDGRLVVATVIPAGATRIIAPADNNSRTTTAFLTEWFNLSPADAIFVGGSSDWEQLSANDRIQIIDVNGDLQDDVSYRDTSPWPVDNNSASVYVLDGFIDAVSNDAGANWALSADGVDNAYQTPLIVGGGATDNQDIGSPGLKPGVVAPPALTYAASRKDHVGGTTSTYDIELFPAPVGTASAGVESRGDGVVSRLVLGFDNPATFGCGDLTINLGSHTCTGVTDLGGNAYEVALTGGTNNSCLEVLLSGAGLNGETVQALNIKGDANASGGVTIADQSKVKSDIVGGSLGVVSAANAASDINLSNGLTIGDLSQVKASSGGTAVCP